MSDDPFPFPGALHQVESVAAKMAPFLAGLSSHMQGAILAELTATWLAGHIIAGSPHGSRALRECLFTAYTEAVRDLLKLEVARRGGDGAVPPFRGSA